MVKIKNSDSIYSANSLSHPVTTDTAPQQSLPVRPQSLDLDAGTKSLKERKIYSRASYQKLVSKLDTKSPQRPEMTARDIKETAKQIKKALELQQWESPIFDNPSVYAYCALKAVENGHLEVEQFCTLMFYFSLTTNHNKSEIEAIPLFKGSEINPDTRQLIKDSSDLNDHQLEIFFESMRNCPSSERQFFMIPDKQPEEAKNNRAHPQRTITQQINAGNYNVFCLTGDKRRMVPSLGMMQTYLNSKFTSPATITPVIGASSLKDIERNGLTKTRDMAIPYPGIALPNTADLVRSDLPYDFIFHDFYHAIVTSDIPLSHSSAIVELGQALLSQEKGNKFISLFHQALIDLEFNFYRDTDSLVLDSKFFWEAVEAAYHFIFVRSIREEYLQSDPKTNDLEYLLETESLSKMTLAKEENLVGKIATIIHDQDAMLKKFNIDSNHIHEAAENFRTLLAEEGLPADQQKMISDLDFFTQLSSCLSR